MAKRKPAKKRRLDKAATARVTRRVIRTAKANHTREELTTGELQLDFHESIRKATPHEAHLTFPIVGIGASAGGVEAVSELFRALPADTGMGYVLIHHLAPHHESLLPEIVAKQTSMVVHRADHLMAVEPNNVYVIPPNRSLGIVHGALRILPRLETRAHHMPIDFFFRCLADDQKSNAIGVILSGGDGDGTQGLKMIKAEGGITFAQDPATAKVPSMPESAVHANVVDFALPVEGIARELAGLGENPYMSAGPQTEEVLPHDDKHMLALFRLLQGKLGVDFTHYKRATLQRRLKRRMLLHKLSDLGAYLQLVRDEPAELESLFEDLLINVTNFFRDEPTFEALKASVFAKLLKKRNNEDPVRIWVPGCATGEEAYSLAMCLVEAFAEQGTQFPVQVFATDLSDSAIQHARAGFYPDDIKTDVSPERLRRFFTKSDGGYLVSRTIRDLVVFAKHDVTRDPPFSRLDFISCRNLLIYLGPVLQKKVIQIFAYALGPGGHLLLGPSETAGMTNDFSIVDKKHKIYQRKANAGKTHIDLNPARLPLAFENGRGTKRKKGNWTIDVAAEVNRIILEKYKPTCVVVTEELQIVQFVGQTTPYLEFPTGEATLDLLKMARSDLHVELRAVLRKAKTAVTPIREEDISFLSNGTKATVDLEIRPLSIPGFGRHYVVFFEEPANRSKTKGTRADAKRGKAGKENKTVHRLREELAATTDYLKSSLRELEVANEELQSANEEILSSNEELQSTNEELETAKEELQSSNEELTTVNEELANRNSQLSFVNDDLKNLLSSVNIPIVMVGNDLKIRKITPQSEKLLNLIPTDVGRPITDIKPNFDLPNLKELILETIDTMATANVSVSDRERRSYSLRIRPYRTAENKIDGAVLIFVDVETPKPKHKDA